MKQATTEFGEFDFTCEMSKTFNELYNKEFFLIDIYRILKSDPMSDQSLGWVMSATSEINCLKFIPSAILTLVKNGLPVENACKLLEEVIEFVEPQQVPT